MTLDEAKTEILSLACCDSATRERIEHILEAYGQSLRAEVALGVPENAYVLFTDGDKWCCVRPNFKNLQESKAGFGPDVNCAIIALQLDEKLSRLPSIQPE